MQIYRAMEVAFSENFENLDEKTSAGKITLKMGY